MNMLSGCNLFANIPIGVAKQDKKNITDYGQNDILLLDRKIQMELFSKISNLHNTRCLPSVVVVERERNLDTVGCVYRREGGGGSE